MNQEISYRADWEAYSLLSLILAVALVLVAAAAGQDHLYWSAACMCGVGLICRWRARLEPENETVEEL